MVKMNKELKETLKEVAKERVRLMIKTFLKNTTSEQCASLRSGNPDYATKSRLAVLITELIDIWARYFLGLLQNCNFAVSHESVSSEMGHALLLTFSQTLDLSQEDAHTSISEEWAEIISAEVVENVVSGQHDLPPKRLNKMIKMFSNMISCAMGKMKTVMCPCWVKREPEEPSKSSYSTTQEMALTDIEDIPEEELQKQHKTPIIGSQDSQTTETCQIVQHVIEKAAAELTAPASDEMDPFEYEEVQSYISQKSELFAKELTPSIEDQIAEETGAPRTTAEPKKSKSLVKKVQKKMKAFFTKCYAVAQICRIFALCKGKSHSKPRDGSKELIQGFIKSVDTLVGNQDWKALTRCQNSSSLEFTELLTKIINENILKYYDQLNTNLYAEIGAKVRLFLYLMNWWISTQSEQHRKRVMLAIKDTKAPSPTTPPRSSPVQVSRPMPNFYVQTEMTDRREEIKAYVKLILHKLVALSFWEINPHCSCGCPMNIISSLLEDVWAKVQDANLTITQDTLKHIEKYLYKDLCKKWGSPEVILLSMGKELLPSLVSTIASSLTHHLSKQRNAIARFFYTLGNVISKPFRRAG